APIRGGEAVSDVQALGHRVDASCRREEQGVVLPGSYLDPIRVAEAKPALGDLGDLVTIALDLVLVVDDIASHAQLAVVLELDLETVPQRGDERLFDRRDRLAVALDLHRVANMEDLLLSLEELLARWGFQDEGVPDSHRLTVDLEYALTLLV